MKKKLTITIDEELLPRAKRYARSRGVSLSALIESSLRELAGDQHTSFVDKWSGRFELLERDDPRYQAIVAKYL